MCAPSPPEAPNYPQAAREQGEQNIEAAKVQGRINNPNVNTPYGTQTVAWGQGEDTAAYDRARQSYEQQLSAYLGAGGQEKLPLNVWDEEGRQLYETRSLTKPLMPSSSDYMLGDSSQPTLTQAFSPEQQAIFEESNKAKLGLSQLATQGSNALRGVVGKQVDFTGAPTQAGQFEDVRKRVLAGMMGRVNEDYGRQSDDLNSNLIAAGIRPGTKAYDDQMALLTRTRTDANTQAELAAQQATISQFGLDTQARKDAIAEMLMQRQVPLNEITALMSGSQVSNPFAMLGYAQNANVAPTNVYGAVSDAANYATDIYNAKAAGASNLQGGLMGVGSAAAMGAIVF